MAQVRVFQLFHDASTPQAFFFLWLCFTLALILLLHFLWPRANQEPLPPSPPKLPVIGHLHHLMARSDSPHVSLRDLTEKHGADGLMLLRLGQVANLIASSPRAAEAILHAHDHAFASRPRSAVADILVSGASDVALAPYGEYWRKARRLVTTHLLTAGKVQSFRRAREEEARLVISKIHQEVATRGAGAVVDMTEVLNSFANDLVCRAVSGKFFQEEGRNKLFRELIDGNVALFGGFNLEDYFPSLAKADLLTRVVCKKAMKIKERWDELLDELIDDHASKTSQHLHGREEDANWNQEEEEDRDFIDVLLSLQHEYSLTREHMKAILTFVSVLASVEEFYRPRRDRAGRCLAIPAVQAFTDVDVRSISTVSFSLRRRRTGTATQPNKVTSARDLFHITPASSELHCMQLATMKRGSASSRICSTWILLVMAIRFEAKTARAQSSSAVHVGALLDLESLAGKASRTSISLALEDFYGGANGGAASTRVEMHFRDCSQDDVATASAAVDLLKNYGVQVLLGPGTPTQTQFVLSLGNRTNVPVVSFAATSPTLSTARSPFFVRTTANDSSQVPALADLVARFGWREVVPVFEDSEFGAGVIPYLVEGLQAVDVLVPNRSVVSLAASDDQITAELYQLMTMQTRVFVLHMTWELAARLFVLARRVGMMEDGYAWIVTDSVCSVLDRLDTAALHAMEGVVCLRPHVPPDRLRSFASRFSPRFQMDNPGSPPLRPTVFQLWAYDTAWAVASAVSQVAGSQDETTRSPQPLQVADNSTELGRLVPRQGGRQILDAIRNTSFYGLAGEFRLDDGQLVSSAYAIVNVVGTAQRNVGFWTPERRLSKELAAPSDGLKPILWPGDVFTVPKGWQLPTAPRTKLRIGVPVNTGFTEFVNVQWDPDTGNVTAITGYCIDIFDAVMQRLPYAVPYEYVPMDNFSHSSSSYTDLTRQVSRKEYDAMVGDTTITSDRSEYVDFTLPYTESGVQMIVPMKDSRSRSLWVFLKPFASDLWLSILILFIFTGFVVWLIEHRVEHSELRADTYAQQFFNVSYFNFFALRTAPKERLQHNLSKFALINWMLVAWLLEKNYSASLTSMMTVRQLQPAFYDIDELKKNGYYVGYHHASFVKDMLISSLGFEERRLRDYSGVDQYHDALRNGTWNGGVAAIFDEVPYLKLLIGKYSCDEIDYSMVGRVYKTGGFGFVFPKGSPLVPDVSRAILNVTEGEMMVGIERKWFGNTVDCSRSRSSIDSDMLDFQSFRGVFYITCTLWAIALLIFVAVCSCKNVKKARHTEENAQERKFIADDVSRNGPVVTKHGEIQILSCMEDGPNPQHESSPEPSSTPERSQIC